MIDTSSSPPLTSEQVSDLTRQTNYGTWRFQKSWKPLHVADAEGCWFTDGAGKRYLDFSSQLMCVNLGHKNPRVVEAIAQQARELCYAAPGYATTSRARLSAKLLEVLPEGLNKFFFATSGTEANEAAFKIARMVTGKNKIISRYRSYHGSTAGSIAATGDPRRWAMEPAGKIGGVVFAPETNCYDCPIKHTYPACNIACADYIEHMIRNEGDVAAIIVEPVVGTNGVLVPPPEYLPRLREICSRHGVLLIADEVMAGWGRTGKWFSVDHWNVRPDILVTAKGITSAYVPLGLCATTTQIADYFEDHYFSHGHTYEAHPLTLGPAVAAIEEMQRLNLVERAAEARAVRPPETRSAQGKASLRRRRARPRPLLRRRNREEPLHQTALQHHARQGGRQAARCGSDCREDDGAGSLDPGLGQPFRHCAPTHRDEGRARLGASRTRRASLHRRRARGSLTRIPGRILHLAYYKPG